MTKKLLLGSFAVLVALAISPACGGSKPNPEDAGNPPPEDAGAEVDAGGNDAGSQVDAGEQDSGIDAGPEDGGIDAGFDAGVVTPLLGRVSLDEVTINGQPALGQGLLISASFVPEQTPVFDSAPGSIAGCRVWELTAADAVSPGVDVGTLDIVAANGTPSIPSCKFSPGSGYLCVGANGVGGTVAVTGTTGVYTFTASSANFTSSDLSAYLRISGAVNPSLNGSFPIVAVNSSTSVSFATSNSIVAAAEPSAIWSLVFGQGPIPGVADPGFLEDSDSLTFSLTPSDGGQIPAFSHAVAVGDDFALDTASQTTISAIPTDGSAFTLACDSANCGNSLVSEVMITTTDGTIPSGSPATFMPPPANKQVLLICTAVLSGSVTIPAGASVYLMNAGATRIRAFFGREGAVVDSAPSATTAITAGHAVIGFTTP